MRLPNFTISCCVVIPIIVTVRFVWCDAVIYTLSWLMVAALLSCGISEITANHFKSCEDQPDDIE